MDKFYDVYACKRKENQSWELAGCARVDRDRADEKRYTDLARLWQQRAIDGGYLKEDE
jgi:hypothetical protein